MKIALGIAGALALAIGTPALAQTPHTFNTTGSGSASSITRTATGETGPTALQMKITGWQSKQNNPGSNSINSATLALYDGGLGITGNGDGTGSNGNHQIDNEGGYTDFILIQFSRAVTLSSVLLNSYTLNGDASPDSDLAFWNASSIAPSVWNANVNLAAYSTAPSLWTAADNPASPACYLGCTRMLSATGASTAWLISAAFLPTNDKDDGFKIAQIRVTEAIAAVPEPATWAMMLVGFGAAGFAMRRSQRTRRLSVRFADAA